MNYKRIQSIEVRRLNFYCITLRKYCHCIFCTNVLSTKVWTTFARLVWIDDVWNYIWPSTCWRRSELELYQTFNLVETVRNGTISDLQLLSDGQNWNYSLQVGEDLQNCLKRSVLELYQTFILLKAASIGSISALQRSIFGRRKIKFWITCSCICLWYNDKYRNYCKIKSLIYRYI